MTGGFRESSFNNEKRDRMKFKEKAAKDSECREEEKEEEEEEKGE